VATFRSSLGVTPVLGIPSNRLAIRTALHHGPGGTDVQRLNGVTPDGAIAWNHALL
jgi:hypothetical protein